MFIVHRLLILRLVIIMFLFYVTQCTDTHCQYLETSDLFTWVSIHIIFFDYYYFQNELLEFYIYQCYLLIANEGPAQSISIQFIVRTKYSELLVRDSCFLQFQPIYLCSCLMKKKNYKYKTNDRMRTTLF